MINTLFLEFFSHPITVCWGKGGSSYRSSERNFGDYGCDSPLALVQSAIKAMKKAAHNDIEFILWSG